MPKAHEHWKVLPHGDLQQVDDSILTVVGNIHMPLTTLPRRMTLARIAGGRLVVFSAIALDEPSMQTIESFGKPAFLVVPSGKHRLDAKIWKQRYPDIQVVAPSGARKKVEKVVPVDTTEPEFDDPRVKFIPVPGTRRSEAALLVHSMNGSTLILNDLVGNIRQARGFGGWFLRATKFAGDEPQIPGPVKWMMIDDPTALRAQFQQWADLPTLKLVLVSHGDPIDDEPAEALRELAHSLDSGGSDRTRISPA